MNVKLNLAILQITEATVSSSCFCSSIGPPLQEETFS